MRRLLAILLFVSLSPGGFAAATVADRELLDRTAREIAEAHKLPGLAVAIAGPDGLALNAEVGLADLEHRVPVSFATRFRMGSLSKLVTVAAVARLVQEGKLDLDAPIRRYVPYVPQWAVEPTPRQLASHTAGIRHYLPKDNELLICRPRHETFQSVKEGLEIFLADPLVFEPGTDYAYSSYGYNLLSAVVEGASGETFLDYLREQITGPLGLDSIVGDHTTAIIPHRTDYYHFHPETGEPVNVPTIDNSYKWASGGLLASARDTAALGRAFLEPGFFHEEILREVFTPIAEDKERGFQVGLGWRVSEDAEGHRIYHHGGAIVGGRAFVLAYPESGIVVTLMTNVFSPIGEKEAFELAAPFLGR